LWTATNGSEAVEVYQQCWSLIDVVLSDVQMPVLDGPEMLIALREVNPTVRLCFITGNLRAMTRAQLIKCGALRVFEKPIASTEDLAQQLWELATCSLDPVNVHKEASSAVLDGECQAEESCSRSGPEKHSIVSRMSLALRISIARVKSMLT
jgi:CheY-like chemotaxis protein